MNFIVLFPFLIKYYHILFIIILCGTIFQEHGQCLFIGLAARSLFVSYCFPFLFFLSMGWCCGVGVFGLIGCQSLSPSLALPTSFNNNNNNIILFWLGCDRPPGLLLFVPAVLFFTVEIPCIRSFLWSPLKLPSDLTFYYLLWRVI